MNNPYLMPIAEQKRLEFHRFAKLVVCAVLLGFFIAILLAITPGGLQ